MFDANNSGGDDASAPREKSAALKALRGLVTVGMLALVFGRVFPSLADYSEVAMLVAALTRWQVAVLILLSAIFLAAYWPVLMAVIPTLRYKEAAVNQLTGTAVANTVPAGGAVAVGVNYAMYKSWGFRPESIWAGLLAAGVWDGLVKAVLPLAGLMWLALSGSNPGIGWAVPVVAAAALTGLATLVVVILRSERGARWVGRAASRIVNPLLQIARRKKVSFDERMVDFRTALSNVLRRSWGRLTVAMLLNHAAMFAVFGASLRFVGVQGVGIPGLLVAFSLARLLSGVPLTPGGVGLVDAGYVGLVLLVSAGVPEATVIGGVLLFRALTFLPPIPLGLASWVFWRSNQSWRRPVGTRPTPIETNGG